MGCGGSREKVEGIDSPLESEMEEVGVEAIDQFFSKASPIIESLESVRSLVVDQRDELIKSTGACCHLNPDFYQTIRCFMWNLSVDNDGDFAKAGLDLTEESPYIGLDGNQRVENQNIMKGLGEYIVGIFGLPEKMKELTEQLTELANELKDNSENYANSVKEKFADDFMALPKAMKHFHGNSKNVSSAVTVAPQISQELVKALDQFRSVIGIVKNADEIKRTNETAQLAIKARVRLAHEVAFVCLPVNERFGKRARDGLARFEEKAEQKKNAKAEIQKRKKK